MKQKIIIYYWMWVHQINSSCLKVHHRLKSFKCCTKINNFRVFQFCFWFFYSFFSFWFRVYEFSDILLWCYWRHWDPIDVVNYSRCSCGKIVVFVYKLGVVADFCDVDKWQKSVVLLKYNNNNNNNKKVKDYSRQ